MTSKCCTNKKSGTSRQASVSLIFLPNNFDVFCDLLGSLSKRDTDDSENVIGKHNFAFLQSFVSYSSRYACKMCSNYSEIILEPALQK